MTLIRHMKGVYIILITAVAFVACKDDEKKVEGWDIEQGSDFQVVDQNFNGDQFEDSTHLEILKELDICSMDFDDSTSTVAKCSPENFEIIPINETRSVKDAFIVYTKAAIQLKGFGLPLPVRHIMVFERENGKLVRTNGFRGEITEVRKTNGGYKDLIISLYVKSDDTVFDCLYSWKDGKYSFEHVVGLDWGEGLVPLKPELKDSMSAEIYNTIMTKNLVF